MELIFQPFLSIVWAGVILLVGALVLLFSLRIFSNNKVLAIVSLALAVGVLAKGTLMAFQGPLGSFGWLAPILCIVFPLGILFGAEEKTYRNRW